MDLNLFLYSAQTEGATWINCETFQTKKRRLVAMTQLSDLSTWMTENQQETQNIVNTASQLVDPPASFALSHLCQEIKHQFISIMSACRCQAPQEPKKTHGITSE